MRRISIVFHRDFKELRRSIAFLIVALIFVFITVAVAVIIPVIFAKQEFQTEQYAGQIFGLIIGLIGYFLPLSVFMTFIWAFTNLSIIKDKVSGNIESLLATQLSPKEVWLGKSMAIFVPGYLISFISTAIILLAMNLFAVIPATGTLILPLPLLLISFIINPLVFLALLLLIVLFSFTNNPDIAITPSFIIGFGLMLGIPLGVALGKINLVSWTFAYWCLGGAAILWIAVFGFYKLLTKESVVLSSKGDSI